MKTNNLVSILVPVYGVGRYIERCVRSLMEQTYERCEFVFVDDCTPDESIAILEKTLCDYPHRRDDVKVIHHELNRGLGAARLTGVENSTGEYLTFVDSDDYVESSYVEKLMEAATKENADLVISPFSAHASERKQPAGTKIMFCRLLMRRGSPHIWGNLVRRELMEKYDIFPIEGIDMAEDFHFMTRYTSICRNVCFLNALIYHYTPDNPESYTKRYTQKSVDSILRSVETVYQYMMKRDPKMKNVLNVSALEFYKGMRMKGCQVVAPDLLAQFSVYAHGRPLNIMQRSYLMALDCLPMTAVKMFSAYYERKYCK